MEIIEKIVGNRIDLILNEVVDAVPAKKFVDCLCYDVVLKSGETIGSISAKLGMNEVLYYVGNIGYEIFDDFRGNGYAPEAVELVKKVFIKNDIHKIIITNDPENEASMRVCEKVGARFVQKVEIPLNHFLRVEKNQKFKNIWELDF